MKHSILAGLAAIAILTPAAVAAPNLTSVVECRANHRDAMAALDRLTAVSRYDDGAGDYSAKVTEYGAATPRALGFRVKALSLLAISDDYGLEDNIETLVDGSYTQVKTAFLRATGTSKCNSEKGAVGERMCTLTGSTDPDGSILVKQISERSNGVVINCGYSIETY